MDLSHWMRVSSYIVIALVLLDSFFGYFVLTGLDIVSITSGGNEQITASANPNFEGNIPADLPAAAEEAVPSGGGGGGGGIVTPNIEISPTEFDIELAVNTNIEKTITDKTIVVSVIHGNNEIGTIQDLEKDTTS